MSKIIDYINQINLPYVLGQFGLILAAVFGIAVLQKTSRIAPRPGWYYYVSIWVVSVMATFLFTDPSANPSYYRFFVGMMLVSVYYRYQAAGVVRQDGIFRVVTAYMNVPIPPVWVAKINMYLSVVTVLVILVALAYSCRQSLSNQNGDVLAEVKKNQAQTVMVERITTQKTAELQRTVDGLTLELKHAREEGERREKQLTENQTLIRELKDLIISLKAMVARIGTNVERSRIGNLNNVPWRLQPEPPRWPLPPVNVVPAPAPVRPYRRPGKNQTIGLTEADSTEQYLARTKPLPQY